MICKEINGRVCVFTHSMQIDNQWIELFTNTQLTQHILNNKQSNTNILLSDESGWWLTTETSTRLTCWAPHLCVSKQWPELKQRLGGSEAKFRFSWKAVVGESWLVLRTFVIVAKVQYSSVLSWTVDSTETSALDYKRLELILHLSPLEYQQRVGQWTCTLWPLSTSSAAVLLSPSVSVSPELFVEFLYLFAQCFRNGRKCEMQSR